MANPVIFDDGGSTRIKLILNGGGAGVMDGLLDVDTTTMQASQTVNRNYKQIQVSGIDHTGLPVPLLPVSNLALGDSFTIESDNGQTVTGTIGVGGHLTILVEGTAGNPPMMEAKQFKKKRRYIIANAGTILKVSGAAGGVPFTITTAGNLYTTVLVTD
jgi:hypothetical protein